MVVAAGALFTLDSCNNDNQGTDDKYTVTFNSQGGTDVDAVKVNKGSLVSEPTAPTKEGNTFAGWYRETTGATAWNFSTDKVESDITLYAKWIAGDAYTVTFNTYGGSPVPQAQIIAKGGKATRPATDPAKDLHAFDDWYNGDDFETKYDFNAEVTGNITIHANYTPSQSRDDLIGALEGAIAQAEAIDEEDYTSNSYYNMSEKLSEAKEIYENIGDATDDEIFNAYMALKLAIENLVEKTPVDGNAQISISPREFDGFVFAVPGEHIYIYAYFYDADGNSIDGTEATFTYSGLDEWAESGISTGSHSLYFNVKSNLAGDLTKQMTISSKDDPSITKTITLKTISLDDLKDMFVTLVNGLNENNITYSDYTVLRKLDILYYDYPLYNHSDELQAFVEKMEECWDAYYELPTRVQYSMTGNISTWTFIDQLEDEGEMSFDLRYESLGTFPVGTFSDDVWEYNEYRNAYMQRRYNFKSGGSLVGEARTSYNSDGSNPNAWEPAMEGTYTIDGNSTSGMLYISITKYYDEDDEDGGGAVDPDPMNIFRR